MEFVEMVILGGVCVFDMEGEVGLIEVGKFVDLVLIDIKVVNM